MFFQMAERGIKLQDFKYLLAVSTSKTLAKLNEVKSCYFKRTDTRVHNHETFSMPFRAHCALILVLCETNPERGNTFRKFCYFWLTLTTPFCKFCFQNKKYLALCLSSSLSISLGSEKKVKFSKIEKLEFLHFILLIRNLNTANLVLILVLFSPLLISIRSHGKGDD